MFTAIWRSESYAVRAYVGLQYVNPLPNTQVLEAYTIRLHLLDSVKQAFDCMPLEKIHTGPWVRRFQ